MNRRVLIAVTLTAALTAASAALADNSNPWPANGPVGIGTNLPLELLHVTGGTNDLLLHSGGSQAIEANARWNNTTRRLEYTRKAYAQKIGFYNTPGGGIGLDVADYGTAGAAVSWKNALYLKDDLKAGFGTTTPLERIHLSGNNHDFLIHTGGTQAIAGNAAWDTPAARWEYTRSNAPAQMINFGYNPLDMAGRMTFSVAPAGTTGNAITWRHALTIDDQGRVGINTGTPTADLSVNGTVLAREVVVSVEAANWPDYVFADGFDLPSLDDTAAFVTANGHLPGLPSADELNAEGLNLANMNALLLQKIEELTLHLIAQDARLAAIESLSGR